MVERRVSDKTRPELQREDTGPVLNHLAGVLYEQAGEMWEPSETLASKQSLTFSDLGEVSADIWRPLPGLLRAWIRETDGDHNSVAHMLKLDVPVPDGTLRRATFHSDTYQALEEGLTTGLVVPMYAYRMLAAARMGVEEPELAAHTLDLGDLSAILRDPSFGAALITLSNTGLGFYEINEEAKAPGRFWKDVRTRVPSNPLFRLGPDALLMTDKGLVVSMDARKRLSEYKARAEYKNSPSGGCPVRFKSYPCLGEYALGYAGEMGVLPEELRSQEESAILGGYHFVRHCVDMLVEARSDAQTSDVGGSQAANVPTLSVPSA